MRFLSLDFASCLSWYFACRCSLNAFILSFSTFQAAFRFCITICACSGMCPVSVFLPLTPFFLGGFIMPSSSILILPIGFPVFLRSASTIVSPVIRTWRMGLSPAPHTLLKIARIALLVLMLLSYRVSLCLIAFVMCLLVRQSCGLYLSLATLRNTLARFFDVMTVSTRAIDLRTILILLTRPGCPPTCWATLSDMSSVLRSVSRLLSSPIVFSHNSFALTPPTFPPRSRSG
mmetsp:Transcript_1283/g.3056  ORF Transcript_1283/g.3056 Transcript_1283/m.3056 type:complete len:232 (-) Transcript_1283:7-702(-)